MDEEVVGIGVIETTDEEGGTFHVLREAKELLRLANCFLSTTVVPSHPWLIECKRCKDRAVHPDI